MTRAAALAFAAGLALATPATAETITLDYRPGGNAFHHVRIADQWLKRRVRIIVASDQASAAAIQVIYFHGRGGRICAEPGVRLYLHEGRSRGGAVTNVNRRYLGRTIKDGWYAPAKFGIGECR